MLNDFYTVSVLKSENGTITCTISFDPGHAVFKGHFPDRPVVPGVCSMALVKGLLEQEMGAKLQLQRAGNVKFLQLLIPADQPKISIIYEQKEADIQANVTFMLAEKVVFKMSAAYQSLA